MIIKPIDKPSDDDYCYCTWCVAYFLKQNGHLKTAIHVVAAKKAS